MLLYYVNIERQKICGRNNNIIAPICIDFSVITPIKFQFINSQNQIVRLDDTNGLYLAGSLKMGEQPYNLLFLSKDYTVDESGAVTFMLDTCTVPYCEKIKKKNTEINIEIGQVALNDKRVICRDYALANPRVYSPSLAPAQIESADYWTKEETQEAIDLAVSGIQISGYVTTEEFEEGLATKQNVITEDEKLDYALISGAPTIPTKTSDLQNDSGFVDANYVADATSAFVTETTFDEALNGKQDVINNDNWLSARYVRTELEPWIGDPEYTVDVAINMVHQEALEAIEGLSGKADKSSIPSAVSQLTNDEGFVTSAYVDSQINEKQDKITSISKLDYALLSGTPTIPTKTSDLTNDSGFITDSELQEYATETYVNSSVSGKADKSEIPLSTSQLTNDSGFITEDALSGKQDKITSENKLAYDLISGAPTEPNPVNVTFEKKNTLSAGVFTADFNGKQIQKYGIDYAARDKIEIQLENAETIPSGTAPTIELQVPSFGAETIIFPSSVQLIDELPETIENVTGKLTYHDIVFRAEKDEKDAVKVYANYAYKFSEDEVDYLYIEAVDDGDIIKLTTQYGSPIIPTLYYSYDKVNWNSVLLDADINLLNAGDKVYFKGDNAIINTPENRVTFSSTGRVNMGGNLFTILSEDGIPSGIQYSCFNSFLRGMTTLVSVKNLIIPDIEYTDSNMRTNTNVYYAMFRECTSLIDMPIMKQKYVYQNMFYAMFRGCTALTKVVVPPADTLCANCYNSLFYKCTNLNDVTVSFTDWNGAAEASAIITPSWLTDVAIAGTFRCPSGLSITRNDSHVPTNWAVLNI